MSPDRLKCATCPIYGCRRTEKTSLGTSCAACRYQFRQAHLRGGGVSTACSPRVKLEKKSGRDVTFCALVSLSSRRGVFAGLRPANRCGNLISEIYLLPIFCFVLEQKHLLFVPC